MRVPPSLGQCHWSHVKACHCVLNDHIAQVPQVSGIAGARLRGPTAMSAGRLELVLLAECIAQPRFRCRCRCQDQMPLLARGCGRGASLGVAKGASLPRGAQNAKLVRKNEMFIHANQLRPAQAECWNAAGKGIQIILPTTARNGWLSNVEAARNLDT